MNNILMKLNFFVVFQKNKTKLNEIAELGSQNFSKNSNESDGLKVNSYHQVICLSISKSYSLQRSSGWKLG